MKKYDFFISHSTTDANEANKLVEKLESKGFSCFIAPRNIDSGSFFAEEIIDAIDNSKVIILLYSEYSKKSNYVFNEITAAASRNKKIIQVRLENIPLTKGLEFLIGSVQWLDSYKHITDDCANGICTLFDASKDDLVKIEQQVEKARKEENSKPLGLEVVSHSRALEMGYTKNQIIMKEIEIDFLCIPKEKFVIDDEIEGTFEDWERVAFIADDISCLLHNGSNIIGYSEVYPVKDESYIDLIRGKEIINLDMTATYVFGGNFNVYIGMIGIVPDFDYQTSYVPLVDWLINKFSDWKKRNINVKNIGISVYSDVLEDIVKIFGFRFVGLNPAKGKIYEISIDDLRQNEIISQRYKDICF